MKTINLVYPEHSDVQYKIHHFPDGHDHLELLGSFNKEKEYIVKCRICNPNDLFILQQLSAILHKEDVQIRKLHIYYLFTARMDRRSTIGEAVDYDLIQNELINFAGQHRNIEIRLYDIHSTPRSVDDYYSCELEYHYAIIDHEKYKLEDYNDVQLCFPDTGARDRFLTLFGYEDLDAKEEAFRTYHNQNVPILCTKVRTPITNELTGFGLVSEESWKEKYGKASYRTTMPIMVIDDICDGGWTFKLAAEKLRELNPPKLAIFVTHAIQLAGIERLAALYDEVIITNSYENWEEIDLPENVEVIDIIN